MMSRPVAVARSVIVTGVVWAVGATVVAVLFATFGASSTIELSTGESRVQLVWLGAHAFVACVASLLGVALGASALTRVGLTSTRTALLLVGGLTLFGGLLVCLGLRLASGLDGSTVLAMAVGLGIGTSAATFFVAQAAESETGLPYGRSAARSSRGWSTR
jgi:hypothetical protein